MPDPFIEIMLESILERKNIKKKEFARKIGIRHPTIYDLCSNKAKQTSFANLAIICDELGIEINELLKLHRSK